MLSLVNTSYHSATQMAHSANQKTCTDITEQWYHTAKPNSSNLLFKNILRLSKIMSKYTEKKVQGFVNIRLMGIFCTIGY